MTSNNDLHVYAPPFNGSSTRHYDELPENFLETVSPHEAGGRLPLNLPNHHDGSGVHLGSLGTMNVGGSEYTLVPMAGSTYATMTMKTESLEHHLQRGSIDKFRYGTGTASLLSPLQLDNQNSLLGMRNGLRTSDMLSNLRTSNTSYVKEEMNPDIDFGQAYETQIYLHQPSQQELERMTAATPPAISGDLLGPACLSGAEVVQYEVTTSQAYLPQPLELPPPPPPQSSQPARRSRARAKTSNQQQQQTPPQHVTIQNNAGPSTDEDGLPRQPRATGNMGPGAGIPRAVYSTSDTTDPLNAEIDDDIYIDTKDLCKRIAYELKQHSIPQAIFAERILCRSQGTLSDLLRNPKPWNKLKSGRETFRRMFNWVQQPLHVRLSILDMYKGPMGSAAATTTVMSPPTPAQNARQNSRARLATEENGGGGSAKRPRLVFTDIQKRTLQAIFKETQRPSREMQQTIAEHLRLDMSTVSNFFMNARRRSRNGSVVEDEPAPYQQVRPITPPPESPSSTPRPTQTSRSRSFKSPNGSLTHHIDEAVAAVAHATSASNHSFHSSPQDLISPDESNVYDILSSNGQLLDDGVQNWDDSLDVKPPTDSDYISPNYVEDDSTTNNNDLSNPTSDVFVSPRSVDNNSYNGGNQDTIRNILAAESMKQPASAPGSVHSN